MSRILFSLLSATLVLAAGAPAHADGPDRFPLDATYRKECGECHVAYPAALLNAGQWRRVMGQLDRHYGVDASLDTATVTQLTAWLEAQAASKSKYADAGDPPRITQTRWFRHEHDEAPAKARRNAGSMASCEACHQKAAQGDYSERDIRLPTKPFGVQP